MNRLDNDRGGEIHEVHIPYVGSNSEALIICSDKQRILELKGQFSNAIVRSYFLMGDLN